MAAGIRGAVLAAVAFVLAALLVGFAWEGAAAAIETRAFDFGDALQNAGIAFGAVVGGRWLARSISRDPVSRSS